MPCMCGDTYCWSCGPAQGNYQCPRCGKWSFDSDEDPCECTEEELKEFLEEPDDTYDQLDEVEVEVK